MARNYFTTTGRKNIEGIPSHLGGATSLVKTGYKRAQAGNVKKSEQDERRAGLKQLAQAKTAAAKGYLSLFIGGASTAVKGGRAAVEQKYQNQIEKTKSILGETRNVRRYVKNADGGFVLNAKGKRTYEQVARPTYRTYNPNKGRTGQGAGRTYRIGKKKVGFAEFMKIKRQRKNKK